MFLQGEGRQCCTQTGMSGALQGVGCSNRISQTEELPLGVQSASVWEMGEMVLHIN